MKPQSVYRKLGVKKATFEEDASKAARNKVDPETDLTMPIPRHKPKA